jgi:cation transport ATPase
MDHLSSEWLHARWQSIIMPHRAGLSGDDSVLDAVDMTEHLQTVAAPKLRHQRPFGRFWESNGVVSRRKTSVIAVFAAAAILVHLILRFAWHTSPVTYHIPLLATLALGGIPLVYELLKNLLRREFGSDLLAGISIVTSVVLGEYLAGSIVVLMLAINDAPAMMAATVGMAVGQNSDVTALLTVGLRPAFLIGCCIGHRKGSAVGNLNHSSLPEAGHGAHVL